MVYSTKQHTEGAQNIGILLRDNFDFSSFNTTNKKHLLAQSLAHSGCWISICLID